MFTWEEAKKILEKRDRDLPTVRDFKQLAREGYHFDSEYGKLIVGDYRLIFNMSTPVMSNATGEVLIETIYSFWTYDEDFDTGNHYKAVFHSYGIDFVLDDNKAMVLGC